MAGFTKKQLENLKLEPENLASIKDAVQETFYNDEDFFIREHSEGKRERPYRSSRRDGNGRQEGWRLRPYLRREGHRKQHETLGIRTVGNPYQDLLRGIEGAIAEYSLKTGTAIGDLTSTDFMTIYADALQRAMQQMIWRFGWFGDKAAALASEEGGGGGKLTAGLDISNFNVCDGLFKRIFAATATKNHTAIAANSETTAAAQISALRKNGAATTLVDTILMDADHTYR